MLAYRTRLIWLLGVSTGVPIEPSAAGASVEPAGDGAPVGAEPATTETGGESRAAALAGHFSGRTAWARNLEAPLRDFLRTETGSAAFLLAGAICALIWANIGTSYERVWTTSLSVLVGGAGVTLDLRHWVNSGLMTLFFFVVGLEARREFDLGDLRDRRRLLLPVVAGIGGMIVPVLIFLAIAGSHAPTGAWGTAMSTDTAFALGMLALVGRRFPNSLRAFMLTVSVVDDLVALIVIAIAFTTSLQVVRARGRARRVRADARRSLPRDPQRRRLSAARAGRLGRGPQVRDRPDRRRTG